MLNKDEEAFLDYVREQIQSVDTSIDGEITFSVEGFDVIDPVFVSILGLSNPIAHYAFFRRAGIIVSQKVFYKGQARLYLDWYCLRSAPRMKILEEISNSILPENGVGG